MVRTPACHAGFAAIAQSVERILGKDEVGSSNLPSSSTITALFVKKRAVLLYLGNFIAVIKCAGSWLTTQPATDREKWPLETCAPEALLRLSSLFGFVSAVLFPRRSPHSSAGSGLPAAPHIPLWSGRTHCGRVFCRLARWGSTVLPTDGR